jgi:hypothetical protein
MKPSPAIVSSFTIFIPLGILLKDLVSDIAEGFY